MTHAGAPEYWCSRSARTSLSAMAIMLAYLAAARSQLPSFPLAGTAQLVSGRSRTAAPRHGGAPHVDPPEYQSPSLSLFLQSGENGSEVDFSCRPPPCGVSSEGVPT